MGEPRVVNHYMMEVLELLRHAPISPTTTSELIATSQDVGFTPERHVVGHS